MLPAMASAEEVDDDLSPPAPQEENYGYVRLVFDEGEQLDLYHGEYITECSPTAAVHDGADEDFLTDGDYLALYYEGKLYCKATLDGVSIDADAVLPVEDFALVPMGDDPTTLGEEHEDETPPAVEVVDPEGESSGSDKTVGTPPSTEPKSKEEDKTTEGEGDPSGSDYGIGDDTQPRRSMRAPVMPTAAEYQNVEVNRVKLSNGQYLASNSADTAINSSTEPLSYVAWYKDGVLTLNGYKGKEIQVCGSLKSDLTVKLKGNSSNTITSSYRAGIIQNGKGGSITVTADNGSSGKLTINATYSYSVAGIDNGSVASDFLGDVTIKGYADVTIKAKTTGDSSSQGYGIYAKNAFILDNASVNITCETPNRTSGSLCNGIYARDTANIDTTGKIKIDVKTAGEDGAYSFGIYAMSTANLTTVKEMEVQWKKDTTTTNSSGGAVYKGASFNTTTHAVNVDETNCYASYRYGTPRTVTVENGELTGPGVPNAKERGNFLAGDKVNLTAPPRQVSATDSTHIPFVKWTSADVSVTNPTSQSGACIMVPSNNPTVKAHYNAFTVQPSFTREDSDQGTVSCTLISTEHSGYPKICRADTLGEVSSSFGPVDSSTTYESKVYKNYNPPGEYVVKVAYNKVTYYSEPFMIDYSERAASVSPVTISGETGQTIIPADVTVTLQDCTFNTSLGGTGSWITNLPAGLTQSVMRVGDNEAKITVSGTPKANCVEQIKVTVPKAALSDGISSLTAPSYESANFDIKTTLTTAAATIQPPVAGQHPDMNPVSADPSKYTVAFENWSVGSSAMSATDTFEADKWYYCYLTFTPQPGYAFASGSDMTYTINGDNAQPIGPWVRLAMKALPSAISLDVSGTVTLKNVKAGSTKQPVKTITVKNHLSSPISNVPITLSNTQDFRVISGVSAIESIPANGTETFQVAPASNLPVGGYSTTVTVGGGISGIIEQSFTVEVSVREVIMLTANTPTYNGEWQTGVTADVADVTIDGNSQRDAGDYTATAHLKSGYYMWPNYTTDSTKDISWSIGKRTPQSTDIVVTPPTNPVYDGNRKDATAKLDSKYTGAGAITISKYVNPDTGEEVQPISAGTYTVYVNVAGGSNFNHAINLTNALSSNWTFTIYKAGQDAPVGLGASAPTSSSGKGKINGTAANMQYTKTPDVPTSWSDCTEGSTMVNPGTYYVRYKGDNNHDASPNVKVIVPEYGAGVTVSGRALSWNDKDNAEYYLYPTTMSDADIRAQWKTGGTVSGALYIGTGGTISDVTVDGKAMKAQTFSFGTIPAGEYKLVIFKPDKYVPKIVSITVESTALDLGQLKLWLYGDVTGDGKVNADDVFQIKRYSAGLSSIMDAGDLKTKAERFVAANVTALTANDSSVNSDDAFMINRYCATLSSVFDIFK